MIWLKLRIRGSDCDGHILLNAGHLFSLRTEQWVINCYYFTRILTTFISAVSPGGLVEVCLPGYYWPHIIRLFREYGVLRTSARSGSTAENGRLKLARMKRNDKTTTILERVKVSTEEPWEYLVKGASLNLGQKRTFARSDTVAKPWRWQDSAVMAFLAVWKYVWRANGTWARAALVGNLRDSE